jgi:hypothetical protein
MTTAWSDTQAEQDRFVERAIRYIEKLVRDTEHGFAMDVGGHLFNGLFRGDLNLLRSTNPWKAVALRRIADDPRVHVSAAKLEACVKTYVLSTRFPNKKQQPAPHFSIWKWTRMWDLVDDPQMIFRFAEWAAKRNAPTDLIRTAVQIVHPYIAEGGDLDDILVDPKKIGSKDSPYRRMRRLIGVERKLLSGGVPIPEDTRTELLELIGKIEARLSTP